MKEIMITSSVLILCIMLIRRMFKGKISGRLQYALWLLVALRLVIPSAAQIHMAVGSLEEFRIMDIVEAWEERFGDVTERLNSPVQFTMSLSSPLGEQTAEWMLGEDLSLPDSQDGPTSVFLAGQLGLIWLDVFRGIWIGGMVVIALWMIMANIIFMRKLKNSRKEFQLPEELKEKVNAKKITKADAHKRKGKEDNIRFYTTDCLTSSCLYGIPGREAIYLTSDITEDAQKLLHVVTHELCHRKHGDSFWALLRSILLCAYWMNPLVWAAAVLSKRDCELACDEAALLRLGEEERIPYGETLLSIITGKSRLSDIVCTATTMNGSGKSIKERIKFIAEKPKVLGAAVVAALLLVLAVSVAVFTKNPLYSWQTWKGELVLTVGDMRVSLPESIAGISGYEVTEEETDIILYQTASGKETGRFRVLTYEEAVALVNDGRRVVPVGNYGKNLLLKTYIDSLRNYQHTESTTHIYRPEEKTIDEGNENPMLDKNWEVVPLEEEQTDGIIAREDNFTKGIDNAAGVPGADSNSDTTYLIDEGSSEVNNAEESVYLPNEQITVTYTPSDADEHTQHDYASSDAAQQDSAPSEVPADQCYVYVKADYTGVKEKYLEEMEYINGELERVAGRVIVVSINRAIRDEMFALLAKNRTEYLGDASKTGALVSTLPQADGLQYKSIALHTLETEPETALSLDVLYEMTKQGVLEGDDDILFFNAVMLFATIRNLDECSFIITKDGTVPDYRAEYLDGIKEPEIPEPDEYETLTYTYSRADLEKAVGAMWSDEAHESDESYILWLEDLYARIAEYLP